MRNRSKERLQNLLGNRSDLRLDATGRAPRLASYANDRHRSASSISIDQRRESLDELSVDLTEEKIGLDDETFAASTFQKRHQVGKKLAFEDKNHTGDRKGTKISFQESSLRNKDKDDDKLGLQELKVDLDQGANKMNNQFHEPTKTDARRTVSPIAVNQPKNYFPHSKPSDFEKGKKLIKISPVVEGERDSHYTLLPYHPRSHVDQPVLSANRLTRIPCDYHGKHDTISRPQFNKLRKEDSRKATPERSEKLTIGGVENSSQREFDYRQLGSHYKSYSTVKDPSFSEARLNMAHNDTLRSKHALSRSLNDLNIVIDDGNTERLAPHGSNLSKKYRLDRFDQPFKNDKNSLSRQSLHTPQRPLKSILKPTSVTKASSSQLSHESRYSQKPKTTKFG